MYTTVLIDTLGRYICGSVVPTKLLYMAVILGWTAYDLVVLMAEQKTGHDDTCLRYNCLSLHFLLVAFKQAL